MNSHTLGNTMPIMTISRNNFRNTLIFSLHNPLNHTINLVTRFLKVQLDLYTSVFLSSDLPLRRTNSLPGETNLQQLLHSLTPELLKGEYVFCSIKNGRYGDYADACPIASFNEPEGLTLVLPKNAAGQAGLTWQDEYRCITLGVHSSLQAVGLTAAVAGALAENGISANVIAACFHDHVFVPSELASRALGILLALNN